MVSMLERLPRDILHHLVFLGAASTPLEAPHNLGTLLRTSSALFEALSLHSCPHLYADIYHSKFDRGHWQVSTTLAAKLVDRYSALQRIRRRDFSHRFLLWDLQTLLQMVVEDRGKNMGQLHNSGFSKYIIECIEWRRSFSRTSGHRDACSDEIESVVIWLLCLTLSRSDISNTPAEIRRKILKFLRPFTLSLPTLTSVDPLSPCFSSCSLARSIPGSNEPRVLAANGSNTASNQCQSRRAVPWLRPTYAAIILAFSLEVVPLAIPQHLPETRAIANATHRSGPTKEDMLLIRNYRTPLFAETKDKLCPTQSSDDVVLEAVAGCDSTFPRLLWGADEAKEKEALGYVPGRMAGLWEGYYVVASMTSPPNGADGLEESSMDFHCMKPMQWAIKEYICFNSDTPLPADSHEWDIDPSSLHETSEGLEWSSTKFLYEHWQGTASSDKSIGASQDAGRQIVDIVIIGETLEDHEQAWGGFRFAGRIGRDGTISFKREPKLLDDGESETWSFEGRLQYGAAFVGRWRTGSAFNDIGIQGIFSLHKRGES